jgi:hypothetical protein
MDKRYRDELGEEVHTKFHGDLLEKCMNLVKQSRSKMADRYESWDRQHQVYLSRMPMDKGDRQNLEQGVPPKFIVPLTFAQVQTFCAFCFLLFGQNKRFYELEPTGEEDAEVLDATELVIDGDLKANKWSQLLYQFLVDVAKFGVGVFRTSWRVEKTDVPVEAPTRINDDVTALQTEEETVTAFEGNRIYNCSPYCFFPDHRLPTRDFQRGEYCASSEEYTESELKDLEQDDIITGLKHVEKLSFKSDFGIDRMRFAAIDPKNPQAGLYSVMQIQIRLIPNDWKLANGRGKLGDSKRPKLYLVWVANDSRIIRFEPLNAYHNEFTYAAAELLPDIHEKLNLGFAELIDVLQSVVGWFINSRIQSVSRTIDNWLVADPSGIDLATIENRSRVILLKKAAARLGVERFVKQLTVQDNTTGHINDAQLLMQLMQTVTGINENAQGQYNSGRRSATEARAVINGASARMRMLAELIWVGGLAPVGRQIMLNARQSMSQETFARRVGIGKVMQYPLFHQPPAAIVANSDHFIMNGTLPSEKSFMAQSLQELLGIVLQSPEAAAMFNLDPNKLMREIYELRGIPGLGRFGFSPEEQGRLAQAQQASAGGAEAPAGGAGNVVGLPPAA